MGGGGVKRKKFKTLSRREKIRLNYFNKKKEDRTAVESVDVDGSAVEVAAPAPIAVDTDDLADIEDEGEY